MDGANYLGEGYKLYEVNFKGLFSSTTPLGKGKLFRIVESTVH